jgi:hypothetical protein
MAVYESTAERSAVVDLFARMLRAVDARDWETAQACFADDVDADYSSIGGVDSVVPADDLGAGWAENLGRLDATHHLLGEPTVDLDLDLDAGRAIGRAPFQAQHVLTPGGDEHDDGPITWLLGGRYAFDCVRGDEGWLIEGLTMTAVWDTGDPEIFASATDGEGRIGFEPGISPTATPSPRRSGPSPPSRPHPSRSVPFRSGR